MDTDRRVYRSGSMLLVGLCLLITIGSLPSCRKVKPQRPEITDFDDSLTVGNSYVSSPIIIEIADLEKKINDKLKIVLVSERNLKNEKLRKLDLKVERSGPIKLSYDGHKMSFSAPLTIYLNNPLRLSKKTDPDREPFCIMDVRFQSPLNVRNDWRVQTKSTFYKYEWVKPPSLKVLGINIPVVKTVENLIEKNKDSIEVAIDRAVYQNLRLDRSLRKVWQDIQKPLLIHKKIDSVWLIPKPYRVQVAPLSGNQQNLVLPIRIFLKIGSALGPRPQYALSGKLPRLERVKSLAMVSDLNMLTSIYYEDLNKILAKEIKDEKLKVAGHMLKVKKARVYGGGKTLIVETEVGGAVKGTLFFRGRPEFDTTHQMLMVKHIDYDVLTEELLLSTADWLLHDTVKDTLQSLLNVPLRSQLNQLPDKVELAFARSKAGRKAAIGINQFRLVPRQIAIRPNSIDILLHLDAKVNLSVKRL
ncbi:DUF4403 family protein [Nibrella saemangeumensis]